MRDLRTKSKPLMIAFAVLLAALLAQRVVRGMFRTGHAHGAQGPHVVDGDTIVLASGQKIRYVGIDTPENGEPLFEEARAANDELLSAGKIHAKECEARPHDEHRRTLATVFAGGKDVSLELLRRGLGRVFEDGECLTGKTLDDYFDAAIGAYERRLGVWRGAPARPASPDEAARLAGQSAFVCGAVTSYYEGKFWSHMNFGADWRTDFTVSVPNASKDSLARAGFAFGPQSVGKKVLAFGHVFEHDGPKITARSPKQIRFVDSCEITL
ncbi:MAG: thermonuclease family protein [Deltaproteobacteria bacterium]|nr:thermonuclease family protein [Deltaproteobacteria bacterium]